MTVIGRGEGEIVGRLMVAMAQARTLDGPAFQKSVEGMLAELELLPLGRLRSRMAEELIKLLLGRRERDGMAVLRCLDRLIQLGDEGSPDRPDWRRVRAAARCLALMRACAEREVIDHRAATAEVDRLAAEFADDPQMRALASATQATLGLALGQVDVTTLGVLPAELGRLAGDDAELAPLLELMRGFIDALQAHENGDPAAAFARFSELLERSEDIPAAGIVSDAAAESAPVLDILQSLLAGVPDTDPVSHQRRLETLRRLAHRPGIAAEERAGYLIVLGMAALRQGDQQDSAQIEAGIADLRAAVGLTPPGHPDEVFRLASLALAVYHRSEVSGSLEDVDEAIALLEQARELARDPGHPHWTYVNDMLAQFRRRRGGDTSLSRRRALEGLRGYAWQVLLQPDPTSARAVAGAAASEVTATATRFLADHRPADALRALDAGRGLMLFAATALRDPGIRLVEAGRPELAERWRAEEHPPAWLRQEVLEVLSRDTGLLDPPDLAEIQVALKALEADALVYLVPAAPPVPGWAVIAPVDGPSRYVPLPNLVIEPGTDIERHLCMMGAARDLDYAEQDELVDSIEALCEWAWKAAIGPVVTPYLDAERIPHLVLIPMGEVARLPWQAARGPDGRYLVEQVAVSQAASARMLCETAAATPVRLTSAGLIVADPDTGRRAPAIPSARWEAYAIRQAFYPSATYLGRLPNGTVSRSGAGTPEEVRSWLQSDDATAGAMLHLASHGIMQTSLDSASSRLVLAGDDLNADELIDVLAASPQHQIGLVVLAACHTGRSIHGYDEAYSLATTFLAGGVRSVLSTQWSVPDQDTSLLMYMFHHYLVTERRPPWDALRHAQVWMLDDARKIPPRMPEPLRRTLGCSDPSRVVAWAGFVHWGQ